mmetsp:Transcript_8689/g.16399  ORF Transcript_8689/g.16399 Transcript_8689/m.16399 type:complete len:88 (-) Transcript_8689:170-433(-)
MTDSSHNTGSFCLLGAAEEPKRANPEVDCQVLLPPAVAAFEIMNAEEEEDVKRADTEETASRSDAAFVSLVMLNFLECVYVCMCVFN